ncbi:sigma factor-like helix-turn-helix DNA-binding protein [Bifidobacterium callimiconis]|uniref:RNA polymerase sigma-70 domain-containing protein n=1 Tax=Bifidobacterium callimiconis TaxID=2306973 RepID=A0A430FI11_9BIFI|nr:sigma factor-like helix-turn-helix DNA-binding protein [Bifidobacterium callimiconis]RSX52440.1 hypothetical protein D2E23_0168 [Bifidobacterium callimiconis]
MSDDAMTITNFNDFCADLVNVAQWAKSNGLGGTPLVAVSSDIVERAPQEIWEAITRINSARADVIAEPDDYSNFLSEEDLDALADLSTDDPDMFDDEHGIDDRPEVIRSLYTLLCSYDQRRLDILSSRMLSDDPKTLDEIGKEQSITRERVRQIEKEMKAQLSSLLNESEVPTQLRDLFRHEGDILPQSAAFKHMPLLGENVPLVDVPMWRLVQELEMEPRFEIADGWMAAPSIADAKRFVNETLSADANGFGVVRIGGTASHAKTDQIDDSARNLQLWLQYCGLIVVDDFAFVSCRSVEDFAAALLYVKDRPLTLDELSSADPKRRSMTSMRNAMARDERIIRVSKDKYGLVIWGMPEYSSIRGEIQRILDRNGGSADLDQLVKEIAGRSGASERSIISYAAFPPFHTARGVVTVADADQLKADNDPYEAPRLFRRNDAWILRVTLTKEHERGSGSVLPLALANVLGIEFSGERELQSPAGVQHVYWNGMSPNLGTIKRFFGQYGLAAGMQVFLRFGDDGTFDIVSASSLNGDPLHDVVALSGVEETADPEAVISALAQSIGLPADSVAGDVAARLRKRDDDDLADLVDSLAE